MMTTGMKFVHRSSLRSSNFISLVVFRLMVLFLIIILGNDTNISTLQHSTLPLEDFTFSSIREVLKLLAAILGEMQ